MTRQISLLVSDVPVELDYFVQGFTDHTIGGMVSLLKGVGKIDRIKINISRQA